MNVSKIFGFSQYFMKTAPFLPSLRPTSPVLLRAFHQEPKIDLKNHVKLDGETVEVRFTADWDKKLNNEQVKQEIKRFTKTMIRLKKEQKHNIKIDEERVEVEYKADSESKEVEEEIKRFTEAMLSVSLYFS